MRLKEFSKNNRYTVMLLALMAVVLLFFTITKGSMLWQANVWKGMAMQFPEYGVITLGVMFCFISGHIDMSFVALGDFATILAANYMIANVTESMDNSQVGGVILVAILIALAVGAVGGVINGLLVSLLRIPPVMATIAMQLVWQGISTALTKGYAVSGIPALYTEVGHMYVFGFLPFPLLVFLVVFLLSAFVLRFTSYGEKLYMIGTNLKAARFSAINTTGMLIGTYVICGVLSCLGCLLMVSTMGSAKADYGSSYLMRCILILVLAGVLPDGGMGKIFNVLLSIVTIQIIASGVNMFPQLNTYYASLIWGGLLLIVLIASTRMTGGKARKAKKAVSDTAKSSS